MKYEYVFEVEFLAVCDVMDQTWVFMKAWNTQRKKDTKTVPLGYYCFKWYIISELAKEGDNLVPFPFCGESTSHLDHPSMVTISFSDITI